MKRRKFLIGAGAVTGAAALGIGTGAFNSVEADRDITVETSDDSDALLGLVDEHRFADEDDGKLQLNVKDLNKDATTMFTHLFTVENNGEEIVGIQIDPPTLPEGHMHFFVGVQGGDTLSAYDREDVYDELDWDNPADEDRIIGPGNDMPVGAYFLHEGDDWDEDLTVTINALDEDTAEHLDP